MSWSIRTQKHSMFFCVKIPLDFVQFTTGLVVLMFSVLTEKRSFMQETSVLAPTAELCMVLTGFITVRQGLYGSLDTIICLCGMISTD